MKARIFTQYTDDTLILTVFDLFFWVLGQIYQAHQVHEFMNIIAQDKAEGNDCSSDTCGKKLLGGLMND